MPADYLSSLPSTNKHKLAEIMQCFDPFQPELLDLQKADSDLQKINRQKVNGHQMSQNWMHPICKIWLPNSTKMPTKLFGSDLMITNTLEQR